MVEGELVIAPQGRLVYGGSTLADVSRATERAVGDWRTVIVDLSRVDRIDAAGLGWIARSYASALENGVSFRLLNPARRVQEVLHITKLAQVVPVSCDADEQCLVALAGG